ncbi:MAG: TonB-dependent receptor family protein, partial [Cyclobacteriaceae bacterium]|nr:TonB-dependent receptor family protein [Cyclobacteriaceae bacterium]
EKIELITTPPANFDAEGNAGFINIVLKKNDYEGLNGGISAMLGHGRRERFMAGGNINYRQKKINVFADYSFNYNRRNGIFKSNNEIQNDGYIFNSTSHIDRFGGFNLSTGRMGIDYYLSSKTVIGFLGTFFLRDWAQHTDYEAHYTIEPGIDTLVTGIRIDENPRHQYMANINFQHNFDERQQLNIDFDYFIYSSNQFQSYSNEYFLENRQSVATEDIRIDKITPLNILVGKIDYKLTSSENFTLEAGVKATLSELENNVKTERLENNRWQPDPLFSEFSTMDEDIRAAYSSFNAKLGEKLSIKAGLRYEHTTTDLKDEDGRQVVYRDYGYLFPSAFISRKLTAHSSLNLAYSYRISRPAFSDIAPFVLFIEPKTFVTGNTNLLPALTHSLKTTYTIKNINLSFEYNRISDAFA